MTSPADENTFPMVMAPAPMSRTQLFEDDQAWFERAKQALGSGYRLDPPFTPKYETSLPDGSKHLFKFMRYVSPALDPPARERLRELGIQGIKEYAQGAAAKPAVNEAAWAIHLNKWLDKQMHRVDQRLSGWRIPHAELRQLVRQGLYDTAEDRLLDLNELHHDLEIEIGRYFVWIAYCRGDWQRVIDLYEPFQAQLGTGIDLTMIAEAHLHLGQFATAGVLLAPMVRALQPNGDTARAYMLGAWCSLEQGLEEEARFHLERAWDLLPPEEQARFVELRARISAQAVPTPTAPTAVPNADWQAVTRQVQDLRQSRPNDAYFELQARLAEAPPSEIPWQAQQLAAELALLTHQWSEAKRALDALWFVRDRLEPASRDFVHEELIRYCDRRKDHAGVVAFRQGWDSVPAKSDLLVILGKAFEAESQPEEAERFYRRAEEAGAAGPEPYLFLAKLEFARFQANDDLGHAANVHRYFTHLYRVHPLSLDPAAAENWLYLLHALGMYTAGEEIGRQLAEATPFEDYAAWYPVFNMRREFANERGESQDRRPEIYADHLLAAHAAGQDAKQLESALKADLARLPVPSARLRYLEAIEAIEADGFRKILGAIVVNEAVTQVTRIPKHDGDFLRHLLVLVFSLEGAASYHEVEAMRAEALANAPTLEDNGESAPAQSQLLKDKRIALVGGYPKVLQGAAAVLKALFGATDVTVVPPSWEEHHDKADLQRALGNQQLILVMWKCLKHQTTGIINQLRDDGLLKGCRVIPVAGKGASSFIRAAVDYFAGDKA